MGGGVKPGFATERRLATKRADAQRNAKTPRRKAPRRSCWSDPAHQPGQNGHGGQVYCSLADGALLVGQVESEQQGSLEQHSSLGQQDCTAVLTAACLLVRQLGGHTTEQPGGQVGSKQQSLACESPPVKVDAAHTPPTTASTSASANPSISQVLRVIRSSLLTREPRGTWKRTTLLPVQPRS